MGTVNERVRSGSLPKELDPLGQLRPQHLVLDLQVADLRGELFLGRSSDQEQQAALPHHLSMRVRTWRFVARMQVPPTKSSSSKRLDQTGIV